MINSSILLKEYNLKVTPQRVAIVDELYSNGHMNIDELYKKLLEKFPSISLATIYKNVNAMVEKVFLNEVKIPDAKSVYELAKEEHSHLVCSSCGMIEDIMIDTSILQSSIKAQSAFKIQNVDVVFSGLCKSCQK
ncbi:Fur family transcriptional regulator [Halarcobacter bivalviorum]|uniref:Peroxide stress transcriptional regulator PerR n=1 Tax=Halarcobacter bivalviorum TaxID=663364 RepID=A0AAX2AAW2_9BACT|nr:Fur family transcriptional regulator [Halarcobacter bivalviorum]AXH12623.1 peroxide stress transcriptional regulator PerR [Halarcobacter bivalviorum]RXK08071.1 transcriptional repressor [Halarcobacter bivalviorum]RXK10453.1 transcriptional repressor [Halarcobacter bivalviorum]